MSCSFLHLLGDSVQNFTRISVEERNGARPDVAAALPVAE